MKNNKKPLIHGALLVNKPIGLTSHDVVFKIRKRIGQKSVGHAGTLDPLASGLLVILLGEATKLSRLILNENKSYSVGVQLGLETDTWDTDGQTISQEDVSFELAEVNLALGQVMREKEFPVPMYSAIKVNGKKLYEYAREDIAIEVPLRSMHFYDLADLKMKTSNQVTFDVSCLKGGYIRTLAHCLGLKLGTKAAISFLERTRSEPFSLCDALALDKVLDSSVEDLTSGLHFKSMFDLLSQFKALTVGGRDKVLMENGAIPNELKRRLVYDQKQVNLNNKETYIKIVGSEDLSLISLLRLAPKTKMKVFRRFNV